MSDLFFVFDVESVGLHGEGFAVGWVVVDAEGSERAAGFVGCEPRNARGTDEDRAWIADHVIPFLPPLKNLPPASVREAFWYAMRAWQNLGARVFSDCGWPVESRFLTACVDDAPGRVSQAPYPLHDVASVLLAAGMDPLECYPRLPNETPAHNPVNDARQSARLLLTALAQTGTRAKEAA